MEFRNEEALGLLKIENLKIVEQNNSASAFVIKF